MALTSEASEPTLSTVPSGGPPVSHPAVVCAGILVSDLFVPVLDRIPRPGELIEIAPPLYQSGGCAANTSIDLASLGVAVRVSGRVGDDALGQQVVDELAAGGVDVSGVARSLDAPTSQTVVLPIAGEDRRFLHCIGANAEYSASDVETGAADAALLVQHPAQQTSSHAPTSRAAWRCCASAARACGTAATGPTAWRCSA